MSVVYACTPVRAIHSKGRGRNRSTALDIPLCRDAHWRVLRRHPRWRGHSGRRVSSHSHLFVCVCVCVCGCGCGCVGVGVWVCDFTPAQLYVHAMGESVSFGCPHQPPTLQTLRISDTNPSLPDIHTHTRTIPPTHRLTPIPTPTYARARARTHTHTHTHARTRTHTHTHVHTHTHRERCLVFNRV